MRSNAPSAQGRPLQATRRTSAHGLRLATAIALGAVFAVAAMRMSATRLVNTEDGDRAIEVAKSIADGRARWGVTDYTHHPLGPAYALVPVIRMGRFDLIRRVPAIAGALAGGVALGVLLFLAPWPLWPGVLASFGALLWQPGYIDWLSNTWQHSWNFSLVFVLIALGCTLSRAAPWLLLIGYLAGWIGYDFIFVQVATLLAVRLAFWSQSDPWRAVLAAVDETIAFVTGVALAVLSHLVQNVLYFSSGMMAVDDLLGSVFIRVNNSDSTVPTLAARGTMLWQLATSYVQLFFLPQWSHWRSMAAAAGITLIGGVTAWSQLRGARRVATPLTAVTLTAIGGLIAWWVIAPGHAFPHPHFFPRMLFVPLLAVLAGAVRVLSTTPPPASVRWRAGWRHLLTAAVIVALLPGLLRWVGERLDAHIYTHVWASTDCAPRQDRITGEFLQGTSPQAEGPARLKTGYLIVGGVNVWGLYLDNMAWRPASGQPWVYEERFAARAAVHEVLLRFPSSVRRFGTLRAFAIELLGAAPPLTLADSSPSLDITDYGFMRGLRYRLDPPVVADGLRLTVREAEGLPVVYDLLAFGNPAASDAR